MGLEALTSLVMSTVVTCELVCRVSDSSLELGWQSRQSSERESPSGVR